MALLAALASNVPFQPLLQIQMRMLKAWTEEKQSRRKLCQLNNDGPAAVGGCKWMA